MFVIISHLIAQNKKIPVPVFMNLRTQVALYLDDSSNTVHKGFAPLEVKRFDVKFYSIRFNIKDSILEMKGKAYERNEKYGLSVALFKAERIGDSLRGIFLLPMSSYVKDESDKSGFFSVSIKVYKNEKLYFRYPFYYLEEYAICNLLE